MRTQKRLGENRVFIPVKDKSTTPGQSEQKTKHKKLKSTRSDEDRLETRPLTVGCLGKAPNVADSDTCSHAASEGDKTRQGETKTQHSEHHTRIRQDRNGKQGEK